MIPGLPHDHSIGNALGAPYGEDIELGGIRATDVLCMVVAHQPGSAPIALDVSAFDVGDGVISSETQDTDGYTLTLVWCH